MNSTAELRLTVENNPIAVVALLQSLYWGQYNLYGLSARTSPSEESMIITVQTDDRSGLLKLVLDSIYESGVAISRVEARSDQSRPRTNSDHATPQDIHPDLFQTISEIASSTPKPESKRRQWRRMMKRNLMDLFDLDELKSLSFDMDIDWDNLKGDIKELRIVEMVLYCERHGKKEELMTWCKKLRPHANWTY